MEFAAGYFKLHSNAGKDSLGSVIKQHIQLATVQGKDVDEHLEKTFGRLDPPPGTEWIWNLFLELHTARQSTGSGPLPINYTELFSWSRLTGIPLDLHEVAAIRAVDNAWIEWATSKD